MKTVEDVKSFFHELIDKYSLNFHPDDPFEEFDYALNWDSTMANCVDINTKTSLVQDC